MTEVLSVVGMGAVFFALVVWADPWAAEWLAHVVWARAQAVKSGRFAYAAARRARLGSGTVVSVEKFLDRAGREAQDRA